MMDINTKTLLSVSDANRNFSDVTKRVETYGYAVILKNNAPRYVVLDFDAIDSVGEPGDEAVLRMARAIMAEDADIYAALSQ